MPNFNHVIAETIDIAETNGNNKLYTVIFCKENQGIYLQDSDGVKRYGTDIVIDSLDSTLTKNPLSANQGRVLNEKIESNDKDLYNKLFNIISSFAFDDAIRSKQQAVQINKLYDICDALYNVCNTKINISDISNDVNTNSNKKVLSAAQGKYLNEKIESVDHKYDNRIAMLFQDEMLRSRKQNKEIEQLKLNVADTLYNTRNEIIKRIQNNIYDTLELNDDSKTKSLSAYQGYILDKKIDDLNNKLYNLIVILAQDEMLRSLLQNREIEQLKLNIADTLYYATNNTENKIKNNIENNLESEEEDKSLSAYQGKVLNEKIEDINNKYDSRIAMLFQDESLRSTLQNKEIEQLKLNIADTLYDTNDKYKEMINTINTVPVVEDGE